MKYFATSDIHSFFTPFKKALDDAGFDPTNEEHKLIVCGDIFDRGDETIEVLDYLLSLEDKFIFVRGNHEDLLAECKKEMDRFGVPCNKYHISNGTAKTIVDLGKRYNDAFDLINKSVNYFETDHYVFVHGWFPYNFRSAGNRDWYEARWWNGMHEWSNGNRIEGKTAVCGHWHTSWGHSRLHNDGVEFLNKIETMPSDEKTGRIEPHVNNEPFIDDGIIALDACTVISGKVNVVVLED